MLMIKAYPNGEVNASICRRAPLEPPIASHHDEEYVRIMKQTIRGVGVEGAIALKRDGKIYGVPPEPLGLSTVPYFCTKRGTAGLTRHGRRQIENGCAVLEMRSPKKTTAFATLTTPPTYRPGIDTQAFVHAKNTFLTLLRRNLLRAGLPDWVIGVIEPHPHRSKTSGGMVPHIHMAFQGRKRKGHWALSKEWFRRAWWRCMVDAGIAEPDGDSSACTRVERVTKSVGRYMSKYLGKTRKCNDSASIEEKVETCPGSWHIISRTLSRLIKASIKHRSGDDAESIWNFIMMLDNPYVIYRGDITIRDEEGNEYWVGGYSKVTQECIGML